MYENKVIVMQKQMKVTMFKHFTIEYDGDITAFDKTATRQMANLLQILIYHRKGISKEELIDEMWQDNSNSQSALKYSIFRLRATLDKIPSFKDTELILTTKNGYVFGKDFEITSDYETVDSYWNQLNDLKVTKKQSIAYANKIVELYKGPFYMSDSAIWGLQIQTYYQNIYEKALIIVCDDFIAKKKYKEILPIAQRAIETNNFFDEIYVFYIKALMELGEYSRAMQLYKKIDLLYENEFGNTPSLKIKSLYKILTSRDEKVIDIDHLRDRLNENFHTDSALYCEYDTFKVIYQAMLHNAQREKRKQFLVIFQIQCVDDDSKQNQHMLTLKKILCNSLRCGDVLSKINKSQIIVLLPCKTMDSGYSIIHRVTSQFYKKVNHDDVKLFYFISSLNEFDDNITKK